MDKKALIAFITGSAAGITCGYFFGKRLTEEKMSTECENKVASAREHFKSMYLAKLNSDLKDKIVYKDRENVDEEEEKKPERTVNVSSPVNSDYSEIVQANDYTKYSKEIPMDANIKEGPYITNEDEYDDFLNIERFDLTYFKEDDVFMDSKELQWPDGLEKVGEDNLTEILNNNEETAYVINEDYGEGYCITIEEGSFSDYMNGN